MKKFIILFTVFFGCLPYLAAQEKTEEFNRDFGKNFEGKMLNELPDFDSFDFQFENTEEFQKKMEDWKSKSEKFSKDLAMKMPEFSDELSYSFPESFSFHLESKGDKETQQNNDELFNKLSDIKGVEVVYISKSLLGMVSNMDMPRMNMGGVDMTKIVSKLETLQIFSAEQANAIKKLKSESDKLLKNGKYETLMFVKDEESKTVFYMKKLDAQKTEMLMISEESDDTTLIRFIGSFTVKDLQELTKNGKKKSK